MLNKKCLILTIALLFGLVVAACAPKTPAKDSGIRGQEGGVPASPPSGYSGAQLSETATGKGGAEERMIVRTAQLSLVVKDAEASLEQVKSIVKELDGYVVDTRMWRQEDQMRGTVVVRVPSQWLDDALSRFKSLAIKVQSESGW